MIDKLNTVNHKNFLDNTLPDKCAQLIIADPPYFEVKGDFDFIWKSFDDYLKDVEKWAIECKRLLADNGTLFWWGDKKKIAYSQIILDKYFELENSLVWRKLDSMQYQYYSPDLARTFNTHNERLLMYCSQIETLDDGFTIPIEFRNPFAKELLNARQNANLDRKTIANAVLCNYQNINSAMAQISSWELGKNPPDEKSWKTIESMLPVTKSFNQLKDEYEKHRRFFYNPMKFEEVLEFSQESHKTKNYDHDTKKPEKLTRALLLTCSRQKDLVIVPFAGSGTECAMSILEGRNFYGYEIEEKHVHTSNKRVKEILRKPQLF